jgi:NitT/TauT family transport system permease protein
MLQASSQFRIPLMFAGVFVIAAMGIVTYLIFAFIERRMTRWAIRGRDMQAFGGG